MQIPENAEYSDLVIQGVTLQVPNVVSESMFTDEIEANAPRDVVAKILQQTFAESWRGNFGKEVTKAIKEVAKKNSIKFTKLADLSDEEAETIHNTLDVDDLQTKLNDYIKKYTPAIRKTAGAESISPVDREARTIAVSMVRDFLEKSKNIGRNARSATYKAWDKEVQEQLNITGLEYIDQMASELIESNPAIRESAEATIKSRQEIADSISLKFGT